MCTWFIPGGEFERETTLVNNVEREVIKPGSFQIIESQRQTWQVFSAFFDGFVNTANIIAFILMIGGAFWILNESKSIDIGIYSFLKFAKKWNVPDFYESWESTTLFLLVSCLYSVYLELFLA
jgi:uncharacterized ion transporter superfamily protein YfcC